MIDYRWCEQSGLLICDKCEDDEYFTRVCSFQELVIDAKSQGWLIKKQGDDWLHYCPKCAKSMKRKSAFEDFEKD